MSPTTSQPKSVTIETVIADLQHIQQVHAETPNDLTTLSHLLDAAKADLVAAARNILQHDHATDPIIDKNA